MRSNALLAAAALAAGLVARAGDARACGPDFATELLSQRTSALLELQPGTFSTEVAALVPPPAPQLAAIEVEPDGVRARGTAEERALYDRGAAAFTAGRTAAAVAAFDALLALPAEQRRHRSTWAAYMLGRTYEDGPRAIAAYRRVRELVAAGFLDELGLGASSLGQEARVHDRAGDVVAAVHLYAAQAAIGHSVGASSLLAIARREAGRGGALAGDPIGQRLLAAYLFTRADELDEARRERLWAELTAAPSLAGADVLAAAAYREGRWALAGTLARRDAGADLAKRVLAKLALRDGDRATADRLLAEVSATCSDDDRVHGERAILALAADRPLDAMAAAWRARGAYPVDAAYVAERVLSVDELIAFVERSPSPDAPRELLARRLMRAGRDAEAMRYFRDDEYRELARRFAAALARGRRAGGDPIERARGLFEASELARRHGLDILGTEVAPDWRIYDANFDPHAYGGITPETPPAGERERVAASAPAHPQRYHYRYLASALAEEAAELLPRRSHAFAAALCHATRYIFHVDEQRKRALYARYVREGAAVDFSATFGEDCPEPAFERARLLLPPRPAPSSPRSLVAFAFAVALLGAAAIAFVGARRAVLAGLRHLR